MLTYCRVLKLDEEGSYARYRVRLLGEDTIHRVQKTESEQERLALEEALFDKSYQASLIKQVPGVGCFEVFLEASSLR